MTATINRLTEAVGASLDLLQEYIGQGNASRGFHDEGDFLREVAESPERFGLSQKQADANLRNYYTARIALVDTEIAEAIEELRAGRGVTEHYYSGGSHVNNEDGHTVRLEDTDPMDANFQLRKPEGVPAELTDAFIRILDLAHEMKFSLSTVAFEKLSFNQTRPRLHGKTF